MNGSNGEYMYNGDEPDLRPGDENEHVVTLQARLLAEAGGGAAPAMTSFGPTPIGILSEDRQWRWDGDGWQPNEQAAAPSTTAADGAAHVSADGQWIWDG